MVQRVITERFDDLDGSPAVETVRFGYAGRDYEVDLNEEHASQLDEALAAYIEHARLVEHATRRRRRPAGGQHRSPSELRAIGGASYASYIDCLVMSAADYYQTDEIYGFDEIYRKNRYTLSGVRKGCIRQWSPEDGDCEVISWGQQGRPYLLGRGSGRSALP